MVEQQLLLVKQKMESILSQIDSKDKFTQEIQRLSLELSRSGTTKTLELVQHELAETQAEWYITRERRIRILF